MRGELWILPLSDLGVRLRLLQQFGGGANLQGFSDGVKGGGFAYSPRIGVVDFFDLRFEGGFAFPFRCFFRGSHLCVFPRTPSLILVLFLILFLFL